MSNHRWELVATIWSSFTSLQCSDSLKHHWWTAPTSHRPSRTYKITCTTSANQVINAVILMFTQGILSAIVLITTLVLSNLIVPIKLKCKCSILWLKSIMPDNFFYSLFLNHPFKVKYIWMIKLFIKLFQVWTWRNGRLFYIQIIDNFIMVLQFF